jgi:lipoprotein-releasing system permease protein
VAAVAIAVSFFIIIVAVAVSAGFRKSIRDGVAAMTGDVRISPYVSSNGEDPVSMPLDLPSRDAILALPGVESIDPVAIRAGIVKNGDIIHGVVVKGIQRSEEALSVSIPHRLSEITGLGVGDALTVYFIGEKVRVRKFTITAEHRDLLEMDDNLIVQANLADIQRLNGWSADEVSCLELGVREDLSRKAVDDLAGEIGNRLILSGFPEEESLYVSSAVRRYPQLFDWLDLLDFNVLFILLLMTVVAGFNMISGLLILLLRQISLIGTLKTLGLDDRGIGRVFVRTGAGVVLKGMLAGNLLGLLFCLVQGTTHLIPLDPANYFVSWVPVHLNLPLILAADVAAFALILLFLWIPTRVISRIDPARTVKAD